MRPNNKLIIWLVAVLLFPSILAFGQGIMPSGSSGGGSPTGAAGGGLTGTYPNPTVATNANMTGDVTSVGNATTLAAGSATNLNSGTLAAARGGAGTINGALKGNGSGTVSQAACADLSNGTTNCSAAVGQLPGVTTTTVANAGSVGEYMSSEIVFGSAVAQTDATATQITTLSPTAGDWDIGGSYCFNIGAITLLYPNHQQ